MQKKHIFEIMQRLALIFIFIFPLIIHTSHAQQEELFYTSSGKISFTSDAPLEVIKAGSDELSGILNLTDRSFSFSIPMSSFQGFNSSLQRTHFNENYLETEKYPKSTFNGKIIEEVDFKSPGTLKIRAKGKLHIHGFEQDRIIRCTIKIGPGVINVDAEFNVPLEDHDIAIPSIVQQKIAEFIDVRIQFTMREMN